MAPVIWRVSLSILLLTLIPGRCQTPSEDIRSAISDARIRSILRGMAVDFTEDSTGDSTAFAFQHDGHLVTLVNQIKGLSLSSCIEGGVDLMKANQWNREHFSTRAYLNDKRCASLASDVSFGGGATNQMIQDFVRQFDTSLVVYARLLANSPASPIGALAWSQAGASTKRMPAFPAATESGPGLLKIFSGVSLKYDPGQWRTTKSQVDGQFAFSHASGGGHAIVIVERTAVPLDAVEDVVLANAQSVDPHAAVVFRHRIWVKGVAFWFLKIEATVATIPMSYWGYFYAGDGFTVQVVTYAEKSRLPEYDHAFTDLLNGFTVSR